MGFRIEQACPQCGGPIELDETDHLIACPYCGVKSLLFTPDYFRLVLPHNAQARNIIYIPYLRLKGVVFSCAQRKVHHRIVDITHLSVPFKPFPLSLGLRPQTLKMKFVDADMGGIFLKSFVKRSQLLTRAAKQASAGMEEKPVHRTYIGEAFNLIYLPVYIQGKTLLDAITHTALAEIPHNSKTFEPLTDTGPRWTPAFLPTLCPNCGWNLQGRGDSVVLICTNCETAWEAVKGRLVKVATFTVPRSQTDTVYLPFWKMAVKSRGVTLTSHADFMRFTNQPKVIQPAWEKQELAFFSPAFKIRPKVFLHLCRQLTISQGDIGVKDRFPDKRPYPVTLPVSEAIQGIKVTLAVSAISKKKVMPLLSQIKFAIQRAELIWLPFRESVHEMIQQDLNISINKNALAFGRYL